MCPTRKKVKLRGLEPSGQTGKQRGVQIKSIAANIQHFSKSMSSISATVCFLAKKLLNIRNYAGIRGARITPHVPPPFCSTTHFDHLSSLPDPDGQSSRRHRGLCGPPAALLPAPVACDDCGAGGDRGVRGYEEGAARGLGGTRWSVYKKIPRIYTRAYTQTYPDMARWPGSGGGGK